MKPQELAQFVSESLDDMPDVWRVEALKLIGSIGQQTAGRIKRIYYPFHLWEDYPAGFYKPAPEGMSVDDGVEVYREFLSDSCDFELGLINVLKSWPRSCEHNLSNEGMNRIAYLGQASVCIERGVPSSCRAGFCRLTERQQSEANELALIYLNKWLIARGESAVTLKQGLRGVSGVIG